MFGAASVQMNLYNVWCCFCTDDHVSQPTLQRVIDEISVCCKNKLFFFDSLNVYFPKPQTWPNSDWHRALRTITDTHSTAQYYWHTQHCAILLNHTRHCAVLLTHTALRSINDTQHCDVLLTHTALRTITDTHSTAQYYWHTQHSEILLTHTALRTITDTHSTAQYY